MKKVIILYASPEKISNSTTMGESFVKGLQSNPDIEIQEFHLRTIHFAPYSFAKNVPQDDEKEFSNLIENLKKADGLIITTPTYNFNVPSQLKNFIDRIGFIALCSTKKNWMNQPCSQLGYLKTYFLVSGGSPTYIQKLLFFIFPPFWLFVVFQYYGAKTKGSLYGGGLTFKNPAKKRNQLLALCEKRGRNFAKKL